MALDETERGVRDDPLLCEQIAQLRSLDNATSLAYDAKEYLCIATVFVGTIVFCEYRNGSGINWECEIPAVLVAVVLIGALQHRLEQSELNNVFASLRRNRWSSSSGTGNQSIDVPYTEIQVRRSRLG